MLLLALTIVWGVVSSIFGWNEPAPTPVGRTTYLEYLETDDDLSTLRNDPAFQALVSG